MKSLFVDSAKILSGDIINGRMSFGEASGFLDRVDRLVKTGKLTPAMTNREVMEGIRAVRDDPNKPQPQVRLKLAQRHACTHGGGGVNEGINFPLEPPPPPPPSAGIFYLYPF